MGLQSSGLCQEFLLLTIWWALTLVLCNLVGREGFYSSYLALHCMSKMSQSAIPNKFQSLKYEIFLF